MHIVKQWVWTVGKVYVVGQVQKELRMMAGKVSLHKPWGLSWMCKYVGRELSMAFQYLF